jgi:Ca-activated chloride channel homolog
MTRVAAETFVCGSRRFPGWRVRLLVPRAVATPCFSHGYVIFGGGFGSHEIYARRTSDGQPAWCLRTKDDGPTAVTALEGFGLVNTESCTLEAFDIRTGELRWEKWLGDPLLGQPGAADGRVFMAYPRAGAHRLGAFTLRTGKQTWERPIGHDVITAPICKDGKVYVATYDGAVTCFDAVSGEVCWSKALNATSAPWTCGDEVYVSQRESDRPEQSQRAAAAPTTSVGTSERTVSVHEMDGEMVAGMAAKHAEYLDRNWGIARKLGFADFDAAVGFSTPPAAAKMGVVSERLGEERVSRTWRYQGSRPVVIDRVLYETTGDRLEARDLETDELLWTWDDARSEAGERRLTPPAVANGRVLVGTWDGRVVSLDATSGAVRWDVNVGAPCHWQPVMAGGRIAVGLEDGSLVSFDTGDARDDGWPMWGGGPGHNGIRMEPNNGRTASEYTLPSFLRRAG